MPLAYALIHEEDGISGVSFPDFPGVVAAARSAEDALRKGAEALTFHVAGMAADGDRLPELRSIAELRENPEFLADSGGAVLALVAFELPAKAVRVNISMDEALLGAVDRAAAAAGQTRSAFLAEAARRLIRS
jgi:predicted RNase H-like HicB family nuclease